MIELFLPFLVPLVWFFVVNPLLFKYSAKWFKISSDITWWAAFKSLFVAGFIAGFIGAFTSNALISLVVPLVIYFLVIRKELKKYNPKMKKVWGVFILIVLSMLLLSPLQDVTLRLFSPGYTEMKNAAEELESSMKQIIKEKKTVISETEEEK